MAAFTYYTESELETLKSVKDKDVNEVYQEVRSFWPHVYIQEQEVRRRRTFFSSWFDKPEPEIRYDVKVDIDRLGHMREVQCINLIPGFFRFSDKDAICAYLFGIIHGAKHFKIESK